MAFPIVNFICNFKASSAHMPDCQCVVMHVGAAHTFDVVSSRGWLCNPGDCCSAQHLLHCCVGLGHLLPVQLLHLGSAVGFLQQHLEHKWEAPFITWCACYTSSIDRSHFKKISLTIKLWGVFYASLWNIYQAFTVHNARVFFLIL